MIRRIKEINPKANIVAIDYDPGAPRVNQENRIKLGLQLQEKNLIREYLLRPIARKVKKLTEERFFKINKNLYDYY